MADPVFAFRVGDLGLLNSSCDFVIAALSIVGIAVKRRIVWHTLAVHALPQMRQNVQESK